MLLTSNISLQPKKEVLIERKAPTQMFAKLFHTLTSGLTSPKEKHQTFTAISMLQELNIALRHASINNIVRLAKDGNDFYFDKEGRDNDLADAMRDFNMNTDTFEATLFNDLYLVLEHEDEHLRYLLEIDIKRVHKVDEMPINIHVNGVIKAMKAQPGETSEHLSQRLNEQFKSQRDYDHVVARYRSLFDSFIESLELTFRSAIRCEEIQHNNSVQVIRPRHAGKSSITDRKRAPMVYQGYHGWDSFALYTFCWMTSMNSMAVDASNIDIVSDTGEMLQSIGDEAVDVTSAAIFDTSIDQAELPSLFEQEQTAITDSDSASWLDFGGSDSSDGGSSCGSSCGSGCSS